MHGAFFLSYAHIFLHTLKKFNNRRLIDYLVSLQTNHESRLFENNRDTQFSRRLLGNTNRDYDLIEIFFTNKEKKV